MGKYESYEALRKHEKEKRQNKKEERKKMRAYWMPLARAVHRKLINMIKDGTAGLNQSKIAQYSGMDPSTVSNFMQGRTKSLRFSTFIAIAGTCGYKVVLEPIDPNQDFLYEKRRVKLPKRKKDLKKGQI